MKYALYSGAGNTFALLNELVSAEAAKALAEACQVDGVLCSEDGESIHIFNKDGSSASACGNGMRCFVRFLYDQEIRRSSYTLVTPAGRYTARLQGSLVEVLLPPPSREVRTLSIEGSTVYALNTGVPHAVLFVPSVAEIPLEEIGPRIRHHPLFPEGANVNFVERVSAHALRLRTFERGVEGETLACGTGATASALAASRFLGLSSPLQVHVRSGEELLISFDAEWQQVSMSGPAVRLGEGTFSFKQDSPILVS